MSGSIKKKKNELDRKQQQTWRKQNNATGIFFFTRQDMEQEGNRM